MERSDTTSHLSQSNPVLREYHVTATRRVMCHVHGSGLAGLALAVSSAVQRNVKRGIYKTAGSVGELLAGLGHGDRLPRNLVKELGAIVRWKDN